MLQPAYTLINQQSGNLAFKIFSFEDNSTYDHLQRLNYYTILLVTEGTGEIKTDFSAHNFSGSPIFAFAPYQPFLVDAKPLRGIALNFHPDFFCIHKHHKEVACNGVLFNNIYNPPFHYAPGDTLEELQGLIAQMIKEILQPGLAQYELLLSYLKIFLITASRSFLQVHTENKGHIEMLGKEPVKIQELKDAIEGNFRTKHSAGEYADTLNISAKALAKITKNHFNKTLTDLIAERIIIEAKRELYLTSKPVKAIAWELGFEDEYYFSRFFKNRAEVSPQLYKDTVGFARAEA